MYSGRTTTTISAPAEGPMDLNATKPQFRELAPLIGLAFLALIPAVIGGALIVVAWPHGEYEHLNGWSALAIGAGALLCYGGGLFFWTLLKVLTHGVKSYYVRLDDWHDAQLTKYIESDGQVTAHQVSEWHLVTTVPKHMLLLLLYIYLTNRTPSIRNLTEGPLLIKAGHRMFSLGMMSQDQATAACDLFARTGIVVNRAAGTAGKLAVLDFKTAAGRVLAELSRDPRVMDAEASQE